MRPNFESLLNRLQSAKSHLQILLPCACALCSQTASSPICDHCQSQFLHARGSRCPRCASRELETDFIDVCGRCLKTDPAYDATIVASDYTAPVDRLVQAYKFSGQLALASVFANCLRDAVLEHAHAGADLPDLLLPVPLGPKRLQERGYNQALEIARPLATALGVQCLPDAVIRVHDTVAQSQLHPDERRRNIRHAFTLRPEAVAAVRDRHIGVVDDVITTGETLNELAATLKRFGAAQITNLVFARTPLK